MDSIIGKYGWISIDEIKSLHFQKFIHQDYIEMVRDSNLTDFVFLCTDSSESYVELISTEIKLLIKREVFRPMPKQPKFNPLEEVKLFNSKGQLEFGKIKGISWHNNEGKHIYTLEVNGKIKTRRYFEEDLEKVEITN